MSLKRLAKELGLSAADDDSVILQVKTLSAKSAEMAGTVKALTAEVAELKNDKAELEATVAGYQEAEKAAECATLVDELVAAGHIQEGGPLAGLIEECYTAGKVEEARALAERFRAEASARKDESAEDQGGGDQGEASQKAKVGAKPELEARQTPVNAELNGGKASNAMKAKSTPVAPDYGAAFARLPEHVRVMAGSKWAQNPQRYFELNPTRAAEVGITR